MGRTFVSVELRDRGALGRFAIAMGELGFLHTVKGRKKGGALALPTGLFFLEKSTPIAALALARRAVRNTNVQAHIFCLPVAAEVRFGSLRPCG
jgi:hypothetical protein